jgi:hypothetical protein
LKCIIFNFDNYDLILMNKPVYRRPLSPSDLVIITRTQ